jgi:hypothetical protein
MKSTKRGGLGGLRQGCTSNWALREPSRAAALGWTPQQSAYMDAVNFGWNSRGP